MKHFSFKRAAAAFLALLLCLLCGCMGQNSSAEYIEGETDPVIVRINGEDAMTLSQFNDMIQAALSQVQSMYGLDLTQPEYQETLYSVQDQCIAAYVTARVQLLKAAEYGLDRLTDEEVEQAVEEVNRQYEYYRQQFIDQLEAQDVEPTDEVVADVMSQYGVSLPALSNDVQTNMVLDKLRNYVLNDFFATEENYQEIYRQLLENQKANIEANEGIFVSYWNQDVLPLYRPEGYAAYTWVLVPFDDETLSALSAQRQQNDPEYESNLHAALSKIKEEAQRVASDIQKDSKKYDEYLTQYGSGTGYDAENLPQGLGYCIGESSGLSEAVVNAARALRTDGQISEPTGGDEGYYIIRRECEIESGEMSYDEVKDIIQSYAEEQLRDQAYSEQLKSWINEQEVEVFYDKFR